MDKYRPNITNTHSRFLQNERHRHIDDPCTPVYIYIYIVK